MKLYVVTADGWKMGCGSELFLIGVFDSEEKAMDAYKHSQELGAYCRIKVIELNEEHPMNMNSYFSSLSNDLYLGGYCE